MNSSEISFKKILVANRGEIAVRIFKTCKRLGIQTVAIYSDADRNSSFSKLADERVYVGPAEAKDSYLHVQNLVNTCKKLSIDAVHPGYGFLSENEQFARALAKENIVFIGPNPSAIKAMGDKIESKKLAKQVGINVIAGQVESISNAIDCVELANQIGFPVMVKASAGGGGKGMRICHNEQDILATFQHILSEAENAFGDHRVFIEKYLENSRHIEIQVMCDHHGNAIHLFERECSIQRRNQKVIEECPSPFLSDHLCAQMCDQALRLARAVNYDSAGTIEFLVDDDSNFYFLEMNTRLQVEHPVTELVTGIDLVEEMIRVADGQALRWTNNENSTGILVSKRGWAIECRVYAEDPHKQFGLPSIGKLKKYIEPHQVDLPNLAHFKVRTLDDNKLLTAYQDFLKCVRIDSGVEEGSDITIFYDPLMAKVITYGSNRLEAILNMRTALDMLVIRGITHNVSLLRAVLEEPNFVNGNTHTNFLPNTFGTSFTELKLNQDQINILLIASSALHMQQRARAGYSLSDVDQLKCNLVVTWRDQKFKTTASIDSKKVQINVNDLEIQILRKQLNLAAPLLALSLYSNKCSLPSKTLQLSRQLNYELLQLFAFDAVGNVKIQFAGSMHHLHVCDEITARMLLHMRPVVKQDHSKCIRSPMPGVIRSLTCTLQQKIHEGQEICVVEAMKMQNALSFPVDGMIKAVHCSLGETVEEGQLLVEIY